MPDTNDVPKITVRLSTDRVVEAPMIGFVRMKLVPLPGPVAEPDVQEDEALAPSKRTP